MIDMDKVGKAITYLRKRAGYTQADLAERIGISDKAVSKWERGLSLPDVSILGKLSILLDTDTDSLLSGDVIHHDSSWCGILMLRENPNGILANTMVFDKPLVHILLCYFLLVGIKKIIVSCSPKDNECIRKEFGDGSEYGISLVYSDDVLKTTDDFNAKNYMIVFGRSFIYGVDQTRFFQRAMADRSRLTVLTLPRKNGKNNINFDASKKIVGDSEDRISTQYQYSDIPILFSPKELLGEVVGMLSSGKGIDFRYKPILLYAEILDRGYVEMPLDTWESIADASQLIRIIEKTCGMKVYSLEEIAWRRGMISDDQLKLFGEGKKDPGFKSYLLSLFD